MDIQATLIDFDKVYRLIDGLSDIDKDKSIKSGLRAASNVFINAGRANLKARMKDKKGVSGNLGKSFVSKLKRSSLGALAGFNGNGNHSYLIDMGTENRTTKSGANRGKVTANNFWTDAIRSNETNAIAKVYEGIERGVTRILNRN
jgi:hypothetical protein